MSDETRTRPRRQRREAAEAAAEITPEPEVKAAVASVKKTVAAKADKPKKSATKQAAPAEDGESFVFVMEEFTETKGYNKFTPPVGSGCVGSIYAPKGSKKVLVKVVG